MIFVFINCVRDVTNEPRNRMQFLPTTSRAEKVATAPFGCGTKPQSGRKHAHLLVIVIARYIKQRRCTMTLKELRDYFIYLKGVKKFFRNGTHMHESTKPLPLTSVQIVFKAALKECRIYKSASVHTLRHSGVYPALFAGRRICWKTASISD